MKQRVGQAGLILAEAVHQLGRILMLLLMLALALSLLLAFRLSFGPLNLPQLASRLATAATGEGISVHMDQAELAWAGYTQGGGMPIVLRLGNIAVRNGAGAVLVQIPQADAIVPPADFFGARAPVQLRARNMRFAMADAPVSGRANIWPGPGYSLAHGELFITIGAGRLGVGAASVGVQSASFTLQARPGAVDVTDSTIALAPSGGSAPHLRFSFSARRQQGWAGTLHATLDAVQAADMAQYWPAPLLVLTRDWVVRNITAGTARNADFSFNLTAPGDLSSLDLTGASGQFSADGVTLHWLQRAAPITQLNGLFTMPDDDNAVITASSAQLGKVALSQGVMRITGLSHKDQFGDLSLALNGQLADVLAVLNAPPLNLLRQTPPGVAAATGQAEGSITLHLPFNLNTSFADIKLGVTAKLHNVTLPTGQSLGFSRGEVALQSDGNSLQLQADARFAGEPAHLTLDEGFASNGRILLNMSGAAGPVVWRYLGLEGGTGLPAPGGKAAPFTLRLTGAAMGAQTAALQMDLTPASLAAPAFGWNKAAATKGALRLTLALNNGEVTDIRDFTAQAPGLNITGTKQGGMLRFASLNIGRTLASGTLTSPASPNAPWVAQFSGAVLDVRQGKQNSTPPTPAQRAADAAPPTGPAWTAQLRFATLYLAPEPAPPLTDFAFTGSGRGSTLLQAQGQAQGLSFSVTPQTATRRVLAVKADDAGLLLRATNEYGSLRGGTLTLQSVYGGAEPAIGSLSLAKARIVDAPDVTKLLQAVTLYGVAAAASGPGLLLDHAQIPFTLEYGMLHLKEARAFSPSLGFTASGTINLGTDVCDLDTTIVPAYALNTLPGKLPLLGRLFTSEKGGGLIAMRAHLSGKIGQADVRVNPLSALTPGFLRGIFGLGAAVAPLPAQ